MQKLFEFIIRNQRVFLFVILEMACLTLFFTFNNYPGATFFNTSNSMVGGIYSVKKDAEDYVDLKYQNERLANENAMLRFQLNRRMALNEQAVLNSMQPEDITNIKFKAAKVINSTNTMVNNYITINKGKKDSIVTGMGVFSPLGAVGIIKKCSDNYCLVNSLLHSSIYISGRLKTKEALGSVKWEGSDPTRGKFLYIPRHIEVKKGDTVLTSGFDNVFPAGVPLGYVESTEIKPDETFYRITIRFAADFSRLNYVYVVTSIQKAESDTLQKNNMTEQVPAVPKKKGK